jgi:hypothetical protein
MREINFIKEKKILSVAQTSNADTVKSKEARRWQDLIT